jgi:hypothetical protein
VLPPALQLQPDSGWVAIDVHSELQILSAFAWYCTTPPHQSQVDIGSSCNWYTLRVANTERFRLILYYSFSCNPTVVWVAIDIHSKLQILSAFCFLHFYWHPVSKSSQCPKFLKLILQSCNWSSLGITIEVVTVLQLECLLGCNWILWRLAIEVLVELQLSIVELQFVW